MAMSGMTAGDIGIEALDLVGKAGLLKKIKRAVDRRRFGRAFAIEIGQEIISLCWLMALQQKAQDLSTDLCHPLALPGNEGFGLVQKRIDVLRAAGRVGVDVIMRVRNSHDANVGCFVLNVKGAAPACSTGKGWTGSANHLRFLQVAKCRGDRGMEMSEREGLELWRRAVTASVRSDAPDLTARQQAILMTIALTPGPHTVRGLAEQLNIAKPAVTRALDALERLDFIKRVRDESDLRNIFLERKPSGMMYLRQFAGLVLAAASGKDEIAVQARSTRKASAA